MRQWIECIPNFSEGRRVEVMDAIVRAITTVSGITLLDRTMDADHHRAVVTFVGDAQAVEEAAFRATQQAATLIDLNAHQGVHPRIGATDVIPLVPLVNATREECVSIARRLGARIGRVLNLPVYLYEEAATHAANRNLADVRRGGYEQLKREIATSPMRAPDFGPRALGAAGAVAVGVRGPLIAFNVNLGTTDLRIAQAIAKRIRQSSGGLPCVKALGLRLAGRQLTQVSMNLTNYTQTGVAQVFALIESEAARYGVPLVESELIGLIPQAALWESAATHLKLKEFSASKVLEYRMQEAMRADDELAGDFVEQLAAPTPTPGGGSAAAHVGAVAASLVMMCVGLALKRLAHRAEPDAVKAAALQNAYAQAQNLQAALRAAISEDAAAYRALMQAHRLPTSEHTRRATIQHAARNATDIPMRVAEQAQRVMQLARAVMDAVASSARSDLQVAIELAQGAQRGALATVSANLALLEAEDAVAYRARLNALQSH